jgi:rfaE bifunctional protein kinase chain/domain
MNSSWVAKWRGVRVFVLGDVMLDKFVYGRVERISPEAPIPVLHHQSEEVMLGGAANVARNIIALGGEVLLVGALGDDPAGDLIAGPLIAEARIEGRFVREAHHPTTTKVRYVSGGQQIMRLDVEQPFSLDAQKIQAICDLLAGTADSVSAIVLSDYAKGVLQPALIERVVAIAKARRLPVIVDPKSRDLARYEGATVLTPNASEAATMVGIDCANDDDRAEDAVRIFRDRAKVEAVVLTRGADGMTIFDPAEAEGPVRRDGGNRQRRPCDAVRGGHAGATRQRAQARLPHQRRGLYARNGRRRGFGPSLWRKGPIGSARKGPQHNFNYRARQCRGDMMLIVGELSEERTQRTAFSDRIADWIVVGCHENGHGEGAAKDGEACLEAAEVLWPASAKDRVCGVALRPTTWATLGFSQRTAQRRLEVDSRGQRCRLSKHDQIDEFGPPPIPGVQFVRPAFLKLGRRQLA